ncbi:hypothetical protein BO71DRAFT_432994 [Aspergillus ellipticus CBS 707.79]|uniref:Uncharacterized protein n=1 Tax=Aspergillus ellipticus CBS 707.79 TaxID=1448320 RepID=A0A319DJD0_9EURO|nr:hypothetical protein BO71DRAFT_432994 [Aspergillus ellipticus CBS 707.79]
MQSDPEDIFERITVVSDGRTSGKNGPKNVLRQKHPLLKMLLDEVEDESSLDADQPITAAEPETQDELRSGNKNLPEDMLAVLIEELGHVYEGVLKGVSSQSGGLDTLILVAANQVEAKLHKKRRDPEGWDDESTDSEEEDGGYCALGLSLKL